MSGKIYLLDTNAVIALLRGQKGLARLLQSAEWVGISIITVLEFLAFRGLTATDESVFQELRAQINVIDIKNDDDALIQSIIAVRKSARLKLPDAIVAATAIKCGAILISQDQQFRAVRDLTLLEIQE